MKRLTLKDYRILTRDQNCTYCKRHFDFVAVDTLCNEIGLKIGNVVPCCTECDKMKGKMDYLQFITLCKMIAKNHNINNLN